MARICENGIYRDATEKELVEIPAPEEHVDEISKIKMELKEIKEMFSPLLKLVGKDDK